MPWRGPPPAPGSTRADCDRVVIGVPGALDPVTRWLRYADHLAGWHSPALLDDLHAALGVPFAVENDVNLVAVAEQRAGAAAGCDDFVLLWADRGIGAAIVLGGRLHRGATGGAGEVGHLPLPGARPPYAADPAGTGGFQELAGGEAVLELARRHGLPATTPQEAVAAAVAGGAAGAALLDELAGRLATGIAALTAVLDPQRVVLSGGVAAAGGEPLRSRIEERLHRLAVPQPALLLGALTADPVLLGGIERALSAARDRIFDTTAP